MKKRLSDTGQRRETALSRDRIIEASIALLDSGGEAGLTFRALSERLATGPGAIYWHVDNKADLLTAACDAIVAGTVEACVTSTDPEAAIRAFALGMFDTIDLHPWVGTALIRAPGQLPMVRILEGIGQQVRALEVPVGEQWTVMSVLLNYILGVGGQNAANSQFAQVHGLDRAHFLEEMSISWAQLDPQVYPFTQSVAQQMRVHDDRADFLAGVDLILIGIKSRGRA